MAPGGAPQGKVCGLHLVGSGTALPPMAAAFFVPLCGKAVMGKDKIIGEGRLLCDEARLVELKDCI